MIVLITGQFQVYDRAGHPIPGKKEWGISHGVDVETGENVCMSGGTPPTTRSSMAPRDV